MSMRTIDEASQMLADGAGTPAITPFRNLTAEALDRIRHMYTALVPSREALGILFALDAAQTAPTEQWMSFFVDTVAAYLIWDERPTGTLIEQDATWLISSFDEAPTLSRLALLVRVTEEAHRTPAWFTASVRSRAALFRSADSVHGLRAKKAVPHLRLVA